MWPAPKLEWKRSSASTPRIKHTHDATTAYDQDFGTYMGRERERAPPTATATAATATPRPKEEGEEVKACRAEAEACRSEEEGRRQGRVRRGFLVPSVYQGRARDAEDRRLRSPAFAMPLRITACRTESRRRRSPLIAEDLDGCARPSALSSPNSFATLS